MTLTISVSSLAKVNLGLKILEKRDDGNHNLHSLFIEQEFVDKLLFSSSESFSILNEGIEVPIDESNLASQAYSLLHPEKPEDAPEYQIHLHKKIPIGAGLGGGSSNAAATLKTLNKLWQLNYSNQKLEKLGKMLGADVPFFISGGCQLAEGIGDILTPINAEWLRDFKFLLVIPPIYISTAWAYKNVNSLLTGTKDIPKFAPLETPVKWRIFENDFEKVVISTYPEIGTIKQNLLEAGALWAGLSGSGSTVYGIFRQSDYDSEIKNDFPASYHTILTKPNLKPGSN